jgi:hypothetical protein
VVLKRDSRSAKSAGVSVPTNPIVGTFCACVAIGHAAAAPLRMPRNSRRLMCPAQKSGDGIVTAQPGALIEAETGFATTTCDVSDGRFRVKSGKPQTEHKTSALPPGSACEIMRFDASGRQIGRKALFAAVT